MSEVEAPRVEHTPVAAVIAAPDVDADVVPALKGTDGLAVLGVARDAAVLEDLLGALAPGPQVVFLHHRLPNMRDHTFVRTASALTGDAPVVLLVDGAESREVDLLAPHTGPFPPAVYAEAERVGAAAVAPWPAPPGTLGRVARGLLRARSAPTARPHTRGSVLGLRCDAGKTGVSELAINIAGLLAARPERPDGLRVLLADLDLMRGDLHLLLRLSLAPTAGLDALWTAAAPAIAAGHGAATLAEETPVASYVTRYPRPQDTGWPGRGHVDVLTAMRNPDNVYAFGGDAGGAEMAHPAVTLLRAWQSVYDVVILDLGADQGPAQLALAAACDTLLVVTTPAFADVQEDAAGLARLLKRTGLAPARCAVAINRWDGDEEHHYTMVDAVKAFRDPLRVQCRDERLEIAFAGAVDEDRRVVAPARWRGYPIPALDPGPAGLPRDFALQVEALVETVLPGLLAPRVIGPSERLTAYVAAARAAVRARFSGGPAPVAVERRQES